MSHTQHTTQHFFCHLLNLRSRQISTSYFRKPFLVKYGTQYFKTNLKQRTHKCDFSCYCDVYGKNTRSLTVLGYENLYN